MKITESKLRQIIREELIRESRDPYADFTEVEKSLAQGIDDILNPGESMTNWKVVPVPIVMSDYPNDGRRRPSSGDLGYVVKKKNPTGGLDGDYYPTVSLKNPKPGSTKADALEDALRKLKRQR
jgi:hypothetical protein